MNIGMLWFDNDPKLNLDIKIERAAAYYRDKYGRSPTLCFVHPSMLRNGKNSDSTNSDPTPDQKFAICGVEIRSNQSVLPNHFWIGVNGAK